MSCLERRIVEREAGIEVDEDGHYGSREVYCKDCEKMTTLGVEDCSFSHEFGIEHQFAIVTNCCQGQSYRDRGPCKFAVKLPRSGKFICDYGHGEDAIECDDTQNDDCNIWEEKV